MALIDQLRLCSSALVLLGEQPIDDFEAGTAPAEVASRLYPGIVDAALASHPWNFSRKTALLTRLPDEAPQPWDYAYARPTDMLRLVRVLVGGTQARGWDLQEVGVVTWANATDEVWAEYHGKPDEAQFSPQFSQALIYLLAADFAVPITEDTDRAGFWRQSAMLAMRMARHQNATEHAVQVPWGRSLAVRLR